MIAEGGFTSAGDAEEFVDAGRGIVDALQEELGPSWHGSTCRSQVLPQGRDGATPAGLVSVPGVEELGHCPTVRPLSAALDLGDERPQLTLGLTPRRQPDGPRELSPLTRRRIDDAHDQLPARPPGPGPPTQHPSHAVSVSSR
jgi:hypothetical protein